MVPGTDAAVRAVEDPDAGCRGPVPTSGSVPYASGVDIAFSGADGDLALSQMDSGTGQVQRQMQKFGHF